MECKIIAHRGANKKAPQNTLPAFRTAIAEGTDGFETDVHLTKDGRLVICHNYTVDATSDGRGDITSYTLEELRLFDFGSYFGADFRGTRLPTLEEFLQVAADGDVEVINIELKSPREKNSPIAKKTLALCKEFGLLDRVLISSFDPRILKTVKQLDPRCRTGLLYPINRLRVCRPVFFEPFSIAKSVDADYIHPMYAFVNRAVVKAAHAMGLGVNVWTVDDARTVRFMLACGVDGLITDCPLEVRGYAQEYAKSRNKEEPGLFELPETRAAHV
ncbi:MAG: glycerophosphodiester phosphodiesterase [Clostridia bacterium]|nr:glycerophosphodiester phosphodiesterase [Clostridia bacterium]